jgi:TPR repeat protein
MDEDGISSGDQFKKSIVDGLENSEMMLFFSSFHSNQSEWTEKEVGYADRHKKRIIPIKLDGAAYNKSVDFDLGNFDYVDFSASTNVSKEKEKLYSCLEKIFGKKDAEERHLDVNNQLLKLAEKYRKGDGVPRDYIFAASLYRKAADQGNAVAQCNLATLYYYGYGVKKDQNLAATLYKMASLGGSALATFKLGKMHFEGIAVSYNMSQAIILFKDAARKGCSSAIDELKRLNVTW